MRYIRFVIIPILLCSNYLLAADTTTTAPTLTIESSKWVAMQNSVLSLENGTLVFTSEFIVLGRGIYGHFDMVAYDADGTIMNVVTSDDRAWRKENGAIVKDIALSLDSAEKYTAVSVSFHEMRESPDAGACITSQQ